MMNGFNQYLCQFCGEPCKKIGVRFREFKRFGRFCQFFACHNCCCDCEDPTACSHVCEVSFITNLQGKIKMLRFSFTDPNKPPNLFMLTVDYKFKYSELLYFGDDSRGRPSKETLFHVNNCMTGLNPNNVQQKIKLLIPFM